MPHNWEDPDEAADAWKRQLLQARQMARDALSECAGPEIDNWGAVNPPELVQFLHGQVVDYHRHILPKSEGIPNGIWDEVVTTVPVPKSTTVEAGMTNWYGEYDVGNVLQKADWGQKTVSLSTLRQEWVLDNTATVEVVVNSRTDYGDRRELRNYSLFLPPAAADAVISQLDRCLENLDWLPEAGEIDVGADSEVLR